MSIFQFAPSPTYGASEHPFVTAGETFSPDEVQKIIEIGSVSLIPATVDSNDTATDFRRSAVSWLKHTPDTAWIYEKLARIANNLNGQFYRFDLWGFCEDLQFTVYEDTYSGCYDFHRDLINDSSPRKLSIVVQLTDPSEYEGGDLQVYTSGEPSSVDKALGKVVAFPSFVMHRVTPVTKGVRRSLVVWVAGPAFR
jgi:PKHD-type hydroxylase